MSPPGLHRAVDTRREASLLSATDMHWLFPGTSSIDTTCTIWGLETGQVLGRVNLVSGHVKTQLIAHDKEVMMLFLFLLSLAAFCAFSSRSDHPLTIVQSM